MPESSPSSTEEKTIKPRTCPVCGAPCFHAFPIEEKPGKVGTWYHCSCGVVFQDELPSHSGYNEKYAKDYFDMKEGNVRLIHSARTYANLIEELTYGRQMLDVGYCVPNVLNFFQERGWIPWGIDVNPTISGKGNLYKGDFLTYDFDIPAKTEELKALAGGDNFRREFDLIWMNHSFEHFNDPLAALRKSHDLLSESGVLYIACPDIDFIHTNNLQGFPHFKKDEHYVMWSKRALVRELERVGFNVVMARRNFSSRFSSWFDVQIIAQKNYF